MTSPENLGPQFKDHIQVYRGYSSTPSPKDIDFNNLGHHWTTNPNVAESFAIQNDDEPEPDFPLQGTVLSGLVHKDHVMKPEEVPDDLGVLDHDAEAEHTIRKGAPVKITGGYAMHFGVGDYSINKKNVEGLPEEGKA
jgi:hypothetical protein